MGRVSSGWVARAVWAVWLVLLGVVLLPLGAAAGGQAEVPPEIRRHFDYWGSDSLADFQGYYFPDSIGLDDFTNTWYSTDLGGLREPMLFDQETAEDVLICRFTCLTSFFSPYSIRIERQGAAARLYFKMCDNAMEGYPVGWEVGDLFVSIEKELTVEEINKLSGFMDQHDFWSMPITDDYLIEDGSQWIIEIKQGDRYHVINRQSPEEGAIYELGNLFLELSGVGHKGIRILGNLYFRAEEPPAPSLR
jgi:hypothetical protein